MYGSEIARISGKYSTAFILTSELTGQNTSGNYSTFKMRVYGYYGGGTSSGSSYGTIWISGTEYGIGSYRLYPGYTLLAQKDITVYHNNDGSFPYTTQAFAINSYHANGEASGALSAPSIPRQANITRCDNFNSNGNPYMEFSNPGGFKLNLRLEFSGTTINRNNYYGSGGYTFQLTEDERNLLLSKCPNGNSLTVRYVVATCIGGGNETNWSYIDRTMTVVDANPQFSNFLFEDINSITVALTGNNQNIIKGYSNVKVTIIEEDKATAIKSAAINKYRFTCGDKNSPDDMTYSESKSVSGTINGVPNGTFNVYAIDSRNNSTLVTKLANEVIDYTPLIKGNIDIGRNNGVSENVTLKFEGQINIVNFGVKTNSIKSAKFRYKSTENDSKWSEPQSIELTVDNGTFSFDDSVKGDTESLGFNVAKSYQIEVIVEDELSSVTYTDKFGSGTPNLALAKNGVGIMGKYDDEVGGLLQVGGQNILKRKVATAYLANEVSGIKNTWIPFNAILSNTDKLSLSNNGIKIGKGISNVLVSGNVFLAANSNNSYLWTATKKIASNGNYDIGIAIDNYNTYFASTSHSPHIIDVKEGDIIKILKIDDNDGTIRANANTYLTVEVMEEDW